MVKPKRISYMQRPLKRNDLIGSNTSTVDNLNPKVEPFISVSFKADDFIDASSQFILPESGCTTHHLAQAEIKDENVDTEMPSSIITIDEDQSFSEYESCHTTSNGIVDSRCRTNTCSSDQDSFHGSDSSNQDFLELLSNLHILLNPELSKLVKGTVEYQKVFSSMAGLLRIILDTWGAASHVTEPEWKAMKRFINKHEKKCLLQSPPCAHREDCVSSHSPVTPLNSSFQNVLEDTTLRLVNPNLNKSKPFVCETIRITPTSHQKICSEGESVKVSMDMPKLDLNYRIPKFPTHIERALRATQPLQRDIRVETINLAHSHLMSLTNNPSPYYQVFASQMVNTYPNLASKGVDQAKRLWRRLLKFKASNYRKKKKRLLEKSILSSESSYPIRLDLSSQLEDTLTHPAETQSEA